MNNKLIYTFIFIGFITILQSCQPILTSYQSRINNSFITDGYTDKSYYRPGDSIQVKIHSFKKINKFKLKIHNINGDPINDIIYSVDHEKDTTGYAYEAKLQHLFTLNGLIPDIEPGTYFLNNKIPFVIAIKNHKKNNTKDGYTDKFSYHANDTFNLFLNSKTDSSNYLLKINDINGKLVKTILCNVFPQKKKGKYPYQNGFGYQVTLKNVIPNLKSGIYLFDNKIPFLIKSKKKTEILILYSSNTENAYSNSGGRSMYSYDRKAKKHTPIVSFLRPISLPRHSTHFLKWIHTQKNYNIGYVCDKDLDNYDNIKNAKMLIIPGHSEYWTRKARLNFDKFVNERNNALILSGNTMWWQVRYNNEKNQLICYKNKLYDNATDSLKTVTWPDSIVDYSVINSIGVDFNLGGYGLKKDKGWNGFKITNPQSPLLKGTGLKYNDIIKLPTSEYDGALLDFSNDSSKVQLKNNLFYRSELIGYDFGFRFHPTNGTWIIFQPKPKSGVIINTASTGWCSKPGMKGHSSNTVKKITLNMIDLMLRDNTEELFTPQ